jgi:glycosyltransferase involved in cell wall biosynthesis
VGETDGTGGDARPLVSVVIPTYNRWPLIQESVQSVLDQTFRDFEVVVVDDTSPDGTAEHLRAAYPSVRVVTQAAGARPPKMVTDEGGGVRRSGLGRRGAARNQGIQEARGRYVAFLDDDDLYEPWHLEQFAEALAQNPDGQLFASRCWLWDPDTGRKLEVGAFDPAQMPRVTLTGATIPQPGVIVTRTGLLEVGGFSEDEVIDGSEDWLLIMTLAHRFPVHRLPRPSVRIRLHQGRSMNNGMRIIESRQAATELVAERGVLGRPLEAESERLLRAATHRFCAGHLYVEGDMAAARKRLVEACRTIGWAKGIPWTARLWLQTWMGPGAATARRFKQWLTWRA